MTALIGVSKSQGMPKFVNKDASDISNSISVGSKTKRPTVRIEGLVLIE